MKSIKDIRILVIGDIMLDRYVSGTVERISPEAPVPIVNVTHEYHSLGGCGNVVRNITELGCHVDCIATVGDDNNGDIIESELVFCGAKPLLLKQSKMTTIKERIIAEHREMQMLRIDRENIIPVDSQIVIDHFKNNCKNDYDAIVVSDYAKGMISYNLMQFLQFIKHEYTNIIVDPKPNHIMMYDGVFMITPNEKEWNRMLLSSATNLRNVKFILETKGDKGMKLIDNSNDKSWDIPTEKVKVYNVSGCGDVVVSVISVCLSLGLDVLTASQIANKCAGFTAKLPGTSIIPKDIFTMYLGEQENV